MTTRRTHRVRRTVRFGGLVALAAAAAISFTAFQSGDNNASASQETKGSVSVSSSSSNGDSKAKSSTETLVDGSTAKITKLGELQYRAEIISDGSVVATMEADKRDAGLDANGMYVVLGMDGKIHSWTGGEQKVPGTVELEGGWTAEVTKLGEQQYRAEILGADGSVMGTIEADGKDAGLNANDVYIVLSARGVISSHA